MFLDKIEAARVQKFSVTANITFMTFEKWYHRFDPKTCDDDILAKLAKAKKMDEVKLYYEKAVREAEGWLNEVKTANGIMAWRCIDIPYASFIEQLELNKITDLGRHWTVNKEEVPNLCGGWTTTEKKEIHTILEAEIPYEQLITDRLLCPTWRRDEFEVNTKQYVLLHRVLNGTGEKEILKFTPAKKFLAIQYYGD